MAQKKVKVDLDHKFVFPGPLTIISRKNLYLIVCGDSGRWIVLKNLDQIEFLKKLNNHSLGEVLKDGNIKMEDAKYVVTQIIARQLEYLPQLKASTDGKPVMHLYLTNACNMRCPHCYMVAGEKYENELTTEEIKDILKAFKHHGDGLITLSGGEVSTRIDLDEICLFAQSIHQRIEILTNGLDWPQSRIETIAPTLSRVQVSVDGYNEESNEIIRGKGAFNKALSTINNFINLGTPTDVAITPVYSLELNDKTKRLYIEFADNLEKKYINKPFKVQFNGEIQDGRAIRLSDVERKKYSEFIRDLLSMRQKFDSTDSSFIGTMKTGIIKDTCAYGNLTIAANGDVYFCAFIPTLKPIGNIRSQSLEELFQLSDKAKSSAIVDNLLPCNKCELKYICGGDCRIHHFPEIKDHQRDMTVQCARNCTQETKEHFYNLMINNNEMLYM